MFQNSCLEGVQDYKFQIAFRESNKAADLLTKYGGSSWSSFVCNTINNVNPRIYNGTRSSSGNMYVLPTWLIMQV